MIDWTTDRGFIWNLLSVFFSLVGTLSDTFCLFFWIVLNGCKSSACFDKKSLFVLTSWPPDSFWREISRIQEKIVLLGLFVWQDGTEQIGVEFGDKGGVGWVEILYLLNNENACNLEKRLKTSEPIAKISCQNSNFLTLKVSWKILELELNTR